MRLKNIIALPHPSGNSIDLMWINPDPQQFPDVRVVRRERTHPNLPQPGSPGEGIVVADSNLTSSEHGEIVSKEMDEGRIFHAKDTNLKGETVYYYTLFPYAGDPPDYQFDTHNRVSAMATSPHNFAAQMYDLLPGIYHRYDTGLPRPGDEVSEGDRQKGQLRRFLDLPGGQFDQLYSFAKAALDLYNLAKLDGGLLPLLAEWIGWNLDHTLEIGSQRNEVKNAPAIYKRIGIIPTVEATVKRISDWESRTKEFVHNVFSSNSPERLNIWTLGRNNDGIWSEQPELLSLDFAYEGRPTIVQDGEGTFWLFYHSRVKNSWDVWYKTSSTFSVGLELENDLDKGEISIGLRQAFEDEGFLISHSSGIEKGTGVWLITDIDNDQTFSIRSGAAALGVYRWTGSKPLNSAKGIDKHPSAAFHSDTLWLFWNSYDEIGKRWLIKYQTQVDGEWSDIGDDEPFADTDNERKRPWTVVDDAGGLWLFWQERVGSGWKLKYNRHDGTGWELDPAADFPSDGTDDPRVENDLFALFHPEDPGQRIWLFWARKEPAGEPDQTRWQIFYRVKQGLDPNVSDWSEIRPLAKVDTDYHDREPCAIINADGNVELFWSSNRGGGWSVWLNTLDASTHSWGTGEEIILDNQYSKRDPVPVLIDDRTLLIFRSNQSLYYDSKIYGATRTFDFRYSGSTTVHTRNAERIALRGDFEDVQAYTYDTGMNTKRTNEDWYARDTIGLYLEPDTMDPEKVDSGIVRIEKVLEEFMPITDRAVFITRSDIHADRVYTYDLPGTLEPSVITGSYRDTLNSTVEELVLGPEEDFSDNIE